MTQTARPTSSSPTPASLPLWQLLTGCAEAVAAAEEHLFLAVHHAHRGRSPLAVENARTDLGVVLAGELVDADLPGLGLLGQVAEGDGDVEEVLDAARQRVNQRATAGRQQGASGLVPRTPPM